MNFIPYSSMKYKKNPTSYFKLSDCREPTRSSPMGKAINFLCQLPDKSCIMLHMLDVNKKYFKSHFFITQSAFSCANFVAPLLQNSLQHKGFLQSCKRPPLVKEKAVNTYKIWKHLHFFCVKWLDSMLLEVFSNRNDSVILTCKVTKYIKPQQV